MYSDHDRDFKAKFRLRFDCIPNSRWNEKCAKCILLIWEVLQLYTYHQPYSPNFEFLKITDFRIDRKYFKTHVFMALIDYFRQHLDIFLVLLYGTSKRRDPWLSPEKSIHLFVAKMRW